MAERCSRCLNRFATSARLRDRLRLQQIVAQGWQFDQTGSLNPCDFVRLLENSKFQKSEPAQVRVMTIHQSKGLEFDIVVLPDLDVPIFKAPDAAFTGPARGKSLTGSVYGAAKPSGQCCRRNCRLRSKTPWHVRSRIICPCFTWL